MKNNRWTWGPWNAVLKRGPVVYAKGGAQIADMRGSTLPTEQQLANMRLVAAAPELAQALQRAVPWLGRLIADGGHLNCVAPNDAVGALQQVEAALAKLEAGEGGE